MEELQLTPLEAEIEKLILEAPAPGRHCGRSALRHLRRACAILQVDPEMAAFRGITAEEEAATAIFHALRRRKYAGAEKLKLHDHLHKNALSVFCEAVEHFLAKNPISQGPMQIVVEPVDACDRLRLRFQREIAPGKRAWVYPIPPLHASVTTDEAVYDFSGELAEIADLKRHPSIEKQLRERANKRNMLLYANSQGIPHVSNLAPFLEKQRRSTFSHLGIFLMIDPYPQKQHFAQQCLQAFLRMLRLLPGDIVFE